MKTNFDLSTKEGRLKKIKCNLGLYPYDNIFYCIDYSKYKGGKDSWLGKLIKPKKHWWQINRIFNKKVFDIADVKSEYDEIVTEEFEKRWKLITKDELLFFYIIWNITDEQINKIKEELENLPTETKTKFSKLIQMVMEIIEEKSYK